MRDKSIVIRFAGAGGEIPVDRVTREGLVLGGESDASPRRVLLTFDAADAPTAFRMQQVRHREGWPPGTFKLKARLEGKRLAFGPARAGADALPGGRYRLRLRVDDLELPAKMTTVDLTPDDPPPVDLQAAPVQRTISVKAAQDPALKRVLAAPGSSLDGRPVLEWLASPAPRASRKACLLNLLAKLRCVETEAGSLLDEVQAVFFADCDRVYAQVTPAFLSRVREDDRGDSQRFIEEGPPRSPVHRRLLDVVEARGLGDPARFALESFRQGGSPGLQAVVAVPKSGRGRHFADLDIDLGNPLEDVRGFAVHMGELIDPSITDHLALHEKLRRPPTGDFLLYELA
jgi:hypothetical protein